MWPAARISKLQFRGILSQVYLQKLLSGGLVKQRPYWLLHIAFFFSFQLQRHASDFSSGQCSVRAGRCFFQAKSRGWLIPYLKAHLLGVTIQRQKLRMCLTDVTWTISKTSDRTTEFSKQKEIECGSVGVELEGTFKGHLV